MIMDPKLNFATGVAYITEFRNSFNWLSESIANKYFGDKDPTGEYLNLKISIR